MKHKTQQGSILLFTLCITAFLALVSAGFIAHSLRALALSKLERFHVLKQLEDSNFLFSYLNELAESNISKTAIARQPLDYNSAAVTISPRYAPGSAPFWGYLEEYSTAIWCYDKPTKITLTKIGHSKMSCLALPSTQDSSLFVHGNLETNNVFEIENQQNNTVRIVVAGTTNFSKGILLKNVNNSVVEIISAGELGVNSISSIGSSNNSVLLFSHLGFIEIGYIDNSLSLCATNKKKTSILSLESKSGFKLGTALPIPGPNLGCPYNKDIKIWPKVVIVGR